MFLNDLSQLLLQLSLSMFLNNLSQLFTFENIYFGMLLLTVIDSLDIILTGVTKNKNSCTHKKGSKHPPHIYDRIKQNSAGPKNIYSD